MTRCLRRTWWIGLFLAGSLAVAAYPASAEVSPDLIVQVSTRTGEEVVRDARVWVAPLDRAESLAHHLFQRRDPLFEGRSARSTDSRGRARFEGLAAGQFVVGAVAPGKAPSMAQVTLRPGVGEAAEVELRLASEVELHVELVGALAKDEILDDAWIVFEGVDTETETESVPDLWLDSFSHHVAGPLTRYIVLHGLAPGTWDVRLVRQTAGDFELLARQQVDLKEVPRQQVRMPIEARSLGGRLLVAGRPWPEVTVSLGGRSVTTDRNGRFSLAAGGPGPYMVELEPREGTSLSLPFVELSSSTSSRLEVPGFVVRGRVVDERGESVAEARVEAAQRVSGMGGFGQESTELAESRTVSQVDGTFELRLPTVGSWSLTAHTEVLAGAPVTVEAGDAKPVDLVLEKEQQIRGTLMDAEGRPVVDASVSVRVFDPETAVLAHSSQVRSDSGGRFELWLPYVRDEGVIEVEGETIPTTVFRGQLLDGFSLILGAESGDLRVMFDGLPPLLSRLVLVQPETGGSLRVEAGAYPNLAAGPWRLVELRDTATWRSFARGDFGALPSLAEVVIRPDRTIVLTLKSAGKRWVTVDSRPDDDEDE